MTVVYILSDYAEYGAEHVHATLRPELLPTMIEAMHPNADDDWKNEAKEALAVLLAHDLSELVRPSGHNLHRGWGGAMLHIVELTE